MFRKSFTIIMGIIIVGLGVIATINYKIDPAGIFRANTYEKGISDILLKGKNVANLSDYNEKELQKKLIEKELVIPNTIILGSSRVMLLDKSMLQTERFRNHGVSGALLSDDIAIWWLYHKKGQVPKNIIIGLDPWLLNKYKGSRDKDVFEKEYFKALDYMQLEDEKGTKFFNASNYKKYFELLSSAYLKVSLDEYKKGKQGKEYYATEARELDVAVRRSDGSLSYPINLRNISKDEVDKSVKKLCLENSMYHLEGFNEFDKTNLKVLEKFIIVLKSEGCNVVFVLPPYHPGVYEFLLENKQYKVALSTEQYYQELAGKYGIPIYGSFNPQKCGFNEYDFYDGVHGKPYVLQKILMKI